MKVLHCLIATTLVVSGCAEVAEKAGKISETFKEAVGTKSKDSSASTAAPAASETSVGGTASNMAPSTVVGASGRPGTPQQAVVAVGGRRVPIASVEMDKYCSQIVAPFDLKGNMEALALLATEVAKESFKPSAKAPNVDFHPEVIH